MREILTSWIIFRLLGKAKIFLESLVESKEHKIHIDVNLTDGDGNPTEVKTAIAINDGHRFVFLK